MRASFVGLLALALISLAPGAPLGASAPDPQAYPAGSLSPFSNPLPTVSYVRFPPADFLPLIDAEDRFTIRVHDRSAPAPSFYCQDENADGHCGGQGELRGAFCGTTFVGTEIHGGFDLWVFSDPFSLELTPLVEYCPEHTPWSVGTVTLQAGDVRSGLGTYPRPLPSPFINIAPTVEYARLLAFERDGDGEATAIVQDDAFGIGPDSWWCQDFTEHATPGDLTCGGPGEPRAFVCGGTVTLDSALGWNPDFSIWVFPTPAAPTPSPCNVIPTNGVWTTGRVVQTSG